LGVGEEGKVACPVKPPSLDLNRGPSVEGQALILRKPHARVLQGSKEIVNHRQCSIVQHRDLHADLCPSAALVSFSLIAVMGKVVHHERPRLRVDGRGHLPVKHLLADGRFGGQGCGHGVAVTLSKLIRGFSCIIKHKQIHGIVDHKHVEGEDGARRVHAEVDVEA
jgi:hypothetical protein